MQGAPIELVGFRVLMRAIVQHRKIRKTCCKLRVLTAEPACVTFG